MKVACLILINNNIWKVKNSELLIRHTWSKCSASCKSARSGGGVSRKRASRRHSGSGTNSARPGAHEKSRAPPRLPSPSPHTLCSSSTPAVAVSENTYYFKLYVNRLNASHFEYRPLKSRIKLLLLDSDAALKNVGSWWIIYVFHGSRIPMDTKYSTNIFL